MNLLQRILVPVDIESQDFHHLEKVIPLAQSYQSRIYLLYVLPEEILETKSRDLTLRLVDAELQKVGEKYCSPHQIQFEKKVEFGKVYESIAYVGDLYDINLIVMSASNTRSPLRLSITTERVIRESEIAVMAVKRDQPLSFEHILCPVDFSDPSRRALKNAVRLAKNFHSKLSILHVIEQSNLPKFLSFGQNQISDDEKIGTVSEQINLFAEEAGAASIPYNAVVLKGDVAEEINRFVKENQVSIMIMGISGSGGLKRMIMGSVTEEIMTGVPCHMIITETIDILEAKLTAEIRTLETHFNLAENLERNNFLEEAIGELKICLHINELHLPSYKALIRIYKKLGNDEKVKEYQQHLQRVLLIQENKSIEEEIRRSRFFNDELDLL